MTEFGKGVLQRKLPIIRMAQLSDDLVSKSFQGQKSHLTHFQHGGLKKLVVATQYNCICHLNHHQLAYTVCPGALHVAGKLKPIFKLFSVIVEVYGYLSPVKCVRLSLIISLSVCMIHS